MALILYKNNIKHFRKAGNEWEVFLALILYKNNIKPCGNRHFEMHNGRNRDYISIKHSISSTTSIISSKNIQDAYCF